VASPTGEAPAEKPNCAICLEALHRAGPSAEDRGWAPEALACGHAFHGACIRRWLAKAATCPLCKGAVADGEALGRSPSVSSVSSAELEEETLGQLLVGLGPPRNLLPEPPAWDLSGSMLGFFWAP